MYLHCRERVSQDLDGSSACEHLMALLARRGERRVGHKVGLSRTVFLGLGQKWHMELERRQEVDGEPSQLSWSPSLLIHVFIWLFLPPDHSAASGLPMMLSHLLDWSCPYTRTCFALTLKTSTTSLLFRGLECLDTPPRYAACWPCWGTAASSRALRSSSMEDR